MVGYWSNYEIYENFHSKQKAIYGKSIAIVMNKSGRYGKTLKPGIQNNGIAE